jgi:hypothetical protein
MKTWLVVPIFAVGCGSSGSNAVDAGADAAPDAFDDTPWIVSSGGGGAEAGYGIATDGQGNAFVTGYYVGNTAIGEDGLFPLGRLDWFLTKVSHGGTLEWSIGGGGGDFDQGFGVATDPGGNVYVAGNYYDDAVFGGTPMTSAGYGDLMIGKLDPAGAFQWAVHRGGLAHEVASAIAADAAGNSYVVGTFQDVVDFGPVTLTAGGRDDGFVAKLDPAGAFLWVTQLGGAALGDEITDIQIDAAGNSYVAGSFGDTVQFGGVSKTSAGGNDVFVGKLDPSGQVLWVTAFGGTMTERGRGISLDGQGNIYASGSFQDTVTFGATTLTSAGTQDLFVVKLDPQGAIQWVLSGGGTDEELARDVAVDASGAGWITGFYRGAPTIAGVTLPASGDMDLYVAHFTSAGVIDYITAAGAAGVDFARAVALDSIGNAYVTGSFELTATFDGTPLTSGGSEDLVVWKLPAR